MERPREDHVPRLQEAFSVENGVPEVLLHLTRRCTSASLYTLFVSGASKQNLATGVITVQNRALGWISLKCFECESVRHETVLLPSGAPQELLLVPGASPAHLTEQEPGQPWSAPVSDEHRNEPTLCCWQWRANVRPGGLICSLKGIGSCISYPVHLTSA